MPKMIYIFHRTRDSNLFIFFLVQLVNIYSELSSTYFNTHSSILSLLVNFLNDIYQRVYQRMYQRIWIDKYECKVTNYFGTLLHLGLQILDEVKILPGEKCTDTPKSPQPEQVEEAKNLTAGLSSSGGSLIHRLKWQS